MKKKLISFLLTLAMLAALTPALAPEAEALGAFADVTDAATAQNVEVLRLMGVFEGDGNGNFRPNGSLTRAEFCKMAVVLTGKRSATLRYGSMTVFPDVKASSWAADYVNYAAKEAKLIHGMPDGSFAPDRAITYGEALAILTRMLGYTDADTGGVWPDGYIALAGEAGMTDGVSATGGASITRAQAAKLFVNALTSEDAKGETLLTKLGYAADTAKDPVTLWSVDTANNKLRLSDSSDPDTAGAWNGTTLVELKGWVVTKDKKAVTFLPAAGAGGTAVSDAAIIVSANGSTAGFDALTGGATNYTIYKNGVRATAAALKKNDVVTYNPVNNTIQACDTRVAAYYENCEPSPAAPTKITVLGGTEFPVLPSAQQSLSQYKPGKTLTLLLTADGKVAGAAENGGNAFAYVTDKGVFLICGGSIEKKLELEASDAAVATSKVLGEVVRVSQSGKNASQIYLSKQSGSTGVLDLTAKTLGTRKLADGALVFSDGKLTSLAALGTSRVEASRIAYARVNAANEVDLIVVKDNSNALYGRAVVTTGTRTDSISGSTYEVRYIAVNYGSSKPSSPIETGYDVRNGDYIEAVLNSAGDRYTSVSVLTKLASVPASAWIGDTAVNYGGQTYTVSASVICWNRDAGAWFDDLDAARAYGGTMDLYVKDGVVRAIEVRA